MFRIFLPVILIFSFSLALPLEQAVESSYATEETENTIIKLVCEAVEDTTWLRVSSRGELEGILERYYTGPLLQEISDAAWDFVRVPRSWDYVTKAGDCTILFISDDIAGVTVEAVETDEITGVCYRTPLQYILINTNAGWKIAIRKAGPE